MGGKRTTASADATKEDNIEKSSRTGAFVGTLILLACAVGYAWCAVSI